MKPDKLSELDLSNLKDLLDYDYKSGFFFWKVRSSARARIGNVAGGVENSGYRRIRIKGEAYLAHRLAWYYYYGRIPEIDIDHINGNKDDNRIENLRLAKKIENGRNRRLNKHNKTGISGVLLTEYDTYKVCINTDDGYTHLGTFKNIFEAACVRKSAEIKIGYHKNHGRTL